MSIENNERVISYQLTINQHKVVFYEESSNMRSLSVNIKYRSCQTINSKYSHFKMRAHFVMDFEWNPVGSATLVSALIVRTIMLFWDFFFSLQPE